MGAVKLAAQGLTGGATGLAVIAIIASIAGFNGESFYHDDKIGIELGMIIDASTQVISVWIRVPRALYIKSTIVDVVKFEDETGTGPVDAGLGDLFPIGATSYGAGAINFEVYYEDDENMPDLSKHDQSIVPMAYIRRASQFPGWFRYMLLGGAFTLNYWLYIKSAILGGAVLLIVMGFGLRYLNKKSAADMVEELKEDVA